MNQIVIVVFACLAATSAYIIQDPYDEEFFLVPLHRQRRQTSVDVSGGGGGGTRATVTHQGTIFNNGVHRLDGTGSLSKQFRPSGPLTVGGNLGYSHIPSGSSLNVGAQRTPGYGTDFSASGNANLWRRGNSRLDAVGSYNRHYGGPWGTGRPNYYGGLQFQHRF